MAAASSRHSLGSGAGWSDRVALASRPSPGAPRVREVEEEAEAEAARKSGDLVLALDPPFIQPRVRARKARSHAKSAPLQAQVTLLPGERERAK